MRLYIKQQQNLQNYKLTYHDKFIRHQKKKRKFEMHQVLKEKVG